MKSMFNSLIKWGSFNSNDSLGRLTLPLDGLIQEQKYINQLADKIFIAYQSHLEKINELLSSVKESEDLDGLVSLIEYRQAELLRALNSSEIAIADTAELEREYLDWRRARGLNKEKSGQAQRRVDLLATELKMRGRLKDSDLVQDLSEPELDTRFVDMDRVDDHFMGQVEEAGLSLASVDGALITPEDELVDYTTVDEEALITHIREITKELARHQSQPVVDQIETLRLANEMRDKYQFLRKQDKKAGKKRDRLAMVDDLRHIF